MESRVAIITLGCAKNTVDSEMLASILLESGVEVGDDPDTATVAVVNTCGFIEPAKEESIDAILEVAELRQSRRLEKLVVCGCLSRRYAAELRAEIAEVDILTGTDPYETAAAVLELLSRPALPVSDRPMRRKRLTPGAWAYLRISEGCSNRCSYCAIPSIRGTLTSRVERDILSEAAQLAESGVKELNIIAQDTTAYWLERGGQRLHVLLGKLCDEFPHIWIRLLYTHPAHYYEELVGMLAARAQICPYLDIPLQHINDRVLGDMGRKIDRKGIEALLVALRNNVPSLVLRTTFIVGFPSESESAFGELLDFVQEMRFERVGAFTYSPEEGTPAFRLRDSVPERLKQERLHRLMSVQRRIAFEHAAGRTGETATVLVEGRSDEFDGRWPARSVQEAPEVDPVILLADTGDIRPGELRKAAITGSLGYDCLAEPLPPHCSDDDRAAMSFAHGGDGR